MLPLTGAASKPSCRASRVVWMGVVAGGVGQRVVRSAMLGPSASLIVFSSTTWT